MKFLAILVPHRGSETPPDIIRVSAGNTEGFRIGNTEVSAWWGAGRHGVVSLGTQSADASFIVKTSESGQDKLRRLPVILVQVSNRVLTKQGKIP